MTIPTRLEFARTLRYMRRHTRPEFFHDHRERNTVTIWKAMRRYCDPSNKDEIRHFLESLDNASPRHTV